MVFVDRIQIGAAVCFTALHRMCTLKPKQNYPFNTVFSLVLVGACIENLPRLQLGTGEKTMRNLPLNQHRVDHLKPRNSTYDIRDIDLKGFGVRILPSGKKSYFLQTQYEGRRRWTKIGDADAMPEAEARSQARSMLAGIGKGRESVSAQPAEIAFEAVAEEVFAYSVHTPRGVTACKPDGGARASAG